MFTIKIDDRECNEILLEVLKKEKDITIHICRLRCFSMLVVKLQSLVLFIQRYEYEARPVRLLLVPSYSKFIVSTNLHKFIFKAVCIVVSKDTGRNI